MVSNADLRQVQQEIRQHDFAQQPLQRRRIKYLLLAVFCVACTVIAFFQHPHLNSLALPWRAFWALFGAWSVPTWPLIGEPLHAKVQTRVWSASALWVGIYGSLGATVLMGYVGYIWWLHAPASARRWLHEKQELHRRKQGQLSAVEAEQQYGLAPASDGIPLLEVNHRQRTMRIGVAHQREMGHTIVIAPTRAGKGLHLTEVLRQWQHAALVIDPKGEQAARTAGVRQLFGSVFNIPHHSLDLSRYYDWTNRNDLTELHRHLIRPDIENQSIFAEKSRFLLDAAGKFARAYDLNPLRVLFEAGNGDIRVALKAWETVAKAEVRAFSNGHPPTDLDDKFVSSAWGTLTTRLYTYYQSVATLTTGQGRTAIPMDWATKRGTVYITYPLTQLNGVGGAMAAVVAGMMRHHMTHHGKTPLLVAIDELPAVGLRNLLTYIATVGGYNITLVLYAQTYGQLTQLYGRDGVETLLSNCRHQLWYPPADLRTADHMSRLYGTQLEAHVSFGRKRSRERFELDPGVKGETSSGQLRKELVLDANAVMALDEPQVICRINRRHAVRGRRLWPVDELDSLQNIPLAHLWPTPPRPPEPIDWAATVKRKAEQAIKENIPRETGAYRG